MPSRKFSLEEGGQKRLEVSWNLSFFGWKDITVRLDGKEVLSFANMKALEKGGEFSLEDGSRIEVRLAGTYMKNLQILRNDRPVPGSDTEPAQKIKIASYILFALGDFAILVGLIFMVIFPEMSSLLGLVILGGVIYFILGAMIRQRSKIAIVASIVLVAISGISSINIGQWSSLMLAAVVIICLIRGYGAIEELEKNETVRVGEIKTAVPGGK